MPPLNDQTRLALRRPSPLRHINYDWLSTAAGLPGKTAHVACAIWYVASLQRSSTIRLAPYATKLFGISRDCCYPSLRRLEEAGLITLDAGRGRTPIITLIDRQARPLAVT
jgi:hypothetical protein